MAFVSSVENAPTSDTEKSYPLDTIKPPKPPPAKSNPPPFIVVVFAPGTLINRVDVISDVIVISFVAPAVLYRL